jgi:hypothetical protein
MRFFGKRGMICKRVDTDQVTALHEELNSNRRICCVVFSLATVIRRGDDKFGTNMSEVWKCSRK